ncbi:MAG: ribose 5-phosphate isomerase [Actinomycetota bacterium]|jgi:ribose 5-phosphate isomerase B|nr:ribose 5-phosphate isomerase [Actinomycetota bacterium]
MRVHIGGDHAAYDLKDALVTFLQGRGYDVVDHGPKSFDPQDDYPVAVLRAAEAVSGEPGSFGVVLGGSGNGEQMAANKVRGIRAALAYTVETAELARTHNDAQVLSIGARMNTVEQAEAMVETFLTTQFSGDQRHARRLAMVDGYERDHQLPPIPAG